MFVMKRFISSKKLNRKIMIAIITFLAALLIAGGSVAYAAFTNGSRVQRTLAAYDSIGDMFSSNQLKKVLPATSPASKTLFVSDSQTVPTTIFSICNYPQGKQTHFYTENISYVLSAEYYQYINGEYAKVTNSSTITGLNTEDDDNYTVTIAARDGSSTLTLNQSTLSAQSSGLVLTGGSMNSDVFTLSFHTNFARYGVNLYVKVTATPVDNFFPTLSAVFKTMLRVTEDVDNWSWEFTDDIRNTPSEYDGFNYRIYGTGSGTIALTWKNDVLSLSAFSQIELLSISGSTISTNNENHTTTITFAVNSENTASYSLQFYKSTSFNDSLTWEQLSQTIVSCSYS